MEIRSHFLREKEGCFVRERILLTDTGSLLGQTVSIRVFFVGNLGFSRKLGVFQEIWLLESIWTVLESKRALLESISYEMESI